MENIKAAQSIKGWAEEDRPREKFLQKGRNALTDAELMAILLGSGTCSESAVELSRRILASFNNNLSLLGKVSPYELTKFKGIGHAKALTIAAALELGRRRKEGCITEQPCLRNSQQAYEYVCNKLLDLNHEEFWVAYLNRNSRVIKEEQVSRGGISGTIVDVKLIVKSALDCRASALILFHNHPSGNPKPSQEDINFTRKMNSASRFFDINVNDHIIFYENKYTSFADEGIL